MAHSRHIQLEPAEPDLEDVYFSTMAGCIGRRREQPEPAVKA